MLASSMAFAGCSDAVGLNLHHLYGGLIVHATDEAGEPVAGVELELRDQARRIARGVTNESGLHEFRYLSVKPYLIVANPPAPYKLDPEQPNPVIGLVVEAGATQPVTLLLTDRFGDVTVTVTDTAGTPISDVRLDLLSTARLLDLKRSDPNGVVEFLNVPAGSYSIRVAVPGGFTLPGAEDDTVGGVIVQVGLRTELRVRLTPATAPG